MSAKTTSLYLARVKSIKSGIVTVEGHGVVSYSHEKNGFSVDDIGTYCVVMNDNNFKKKVVPFEKFILECQDEKLKLQLIEATVYVKTMNLDGFISVQYGESLKRNFWTTQEVFNDF